MVFEGSGLFDDDGTPINPDLIPVPDLCISCAKHNSRDAEDNILCALTRHDEQFDEVFLCFGYQPISPAIDREAVLRHLCDEAGVPYPEASGQPGETGDGAIPF